mmetsp:Transcript_64739/g.76663  ORF Transcript_64739/g.76663 Transcript_64739/m.76663 type:complete len:162 (-) Transcript_64739:647-1132(-)
MIMGILQKLWHHCTDVDNYKNEAVLFHQRLIKQGYAPTTITPLFKEAARKIDTKANHRPIDTTTLTKANNKKNTNNMLFLHQQYNPNNLPNHAIHKLFKEHCGDIFKSELDIERLIIANSKPKSLSSLLAPSKLRQKKGEEVSTMLYKHQKGETKKLQHQE